MKPTFLLHAALLAGFLTTSLEAASPTQKPNFLFVIADDWGTNHAGAYGCRWIQTPNFDRVAREGILFLNAYTPTAKCAPSRSAILTGKNPWQLGPAANHWCFFPPEKIVFPDLLEKAGYAYASTGKVWGPGIAQKSDGSPRNLSGTTFNKLTAKPPTTGISPNDYAGNFAAFLAQAPANQPWFFWLGCIEPHRHYEKGSGQRLAKKQPAQIERVPGYWPDSEPVRDDLLDYALEVEHFDLHLGKALEALEKSGQMDNTVVVVTSDNGMPFPRVKGHTYDASNHLPFAIRWPAGIKSPGRIVSDFVSFIDLAPTFLDLAGAPPIESSPGRSLRDVFNGGQSGRNNPARSHVLIGRERNDVGRPNDVGYPVRGIVQDGWIYLENSEPTRWPAGNPETGYLDTDGSPTKTFILQNHRTTPADLPWQMCFGFRPERELYRLDADPDCILNLATHIEHAARMESLRSQLWSELKTQGDLRALGRGNEFEAFPSADKANAHFYERYLRGEPLRAGWVDQGDFEKIP